MPAGKPTSENGYVRKEDFFSAAKAKEEDFEVDGMKFRLREFKKHEEQGVRDASTANGKLDTDRYEVLAFIAGCAEPRFAEEDIPALRDIGSSVYNKVLSRILELNGLTEDAEKAMEKAFR